MEIGEEKKPVIVEPIENPIPQRKPEPIRQPERTPAPKKAPVKTPTPEKVPA